MKRTSSTRLTACPTPNFIGFINCDPRRILIVRLPTAGVAALAALYHVVGAGQSAAGGAAIAATVLTLIYRAPRAALVNTSLIADEDNGKDRLTRLDRGHEF